MGFGRNLERGGRWWLYTSASNLPTFFLTFSRLLVERFVLTERSAVQYGYGALQEAAGDLECGTGREANNEEKRTMTIHPNGQGTARKLAGQLEKGKPADEGTASYIDAMSCRGGLSINQGPSPRSGQVRRPARTFVHGM
jgi:hypothetical protein